MYRTDNGIEDDYKQHSLGVFRDYLDMMLRHTGPEDEFITTDLFETSVNELDQYITKIDRDQDLDFKMLKVQKSKVGDEESFRTLCNYNGAHNIPYDPTVKHMVYFIEIQDFAVVVIPIQTEKDRVRVRIEPFDLQTPEFLQQKYKESSKKKGIEDIPFVKLESRK